jgi:hypothetical protein
LHGFGSPTDYQKDVANSVLQIGALFRSMTGTGKQLEDTVHLSCDGLQEG